jgi:D,D-heptose 1,7-bisphosphate phosphatase
MIVSILAGGKGTRFLKYSKIPKLLIKFKNYTLLENIINQCKKYKLINFFLFLGFGNKKIVNFLKKKEIKVNYFIEKFPLGTGGSLKKIENLNDDTLVIMGDLLFNINLKKFIKFHKSKEADITLFVHPNNHPYDSDLVSVDKNNRITNFFSKNRKNIIYTKNLATAGIYLIKTKLLKLLKTDKFQDLSKDLIEKLIKNKSKIFAFHSREYIKDVGTPRRYFEAKKDIYLNIPNKRNFDNKMPAFFIDRDGVINKERFNLYSDPCDFFPRTIKAIKKINKMNYLCIIITNQPAIAKGFVSEKYVNYTHDKMETLMGYKGAYIDDIFYCPHHPEKGFKGEVKKYKISCFCRKPKITLIKKAKEKFNIDLKKSYFIGNSLIDYKTAINAGIKPFIVNNNLLSRQLKQKQNFKDLFECVNYLFESKLLIKKHE